MRVLATVFALTAFLSCLGGCSSITTNLFTSSTDQAALGITTVPVGDSTLAPAVAPEPAKRSIQLAPVLVVSGAPSSEFDCVFSHCERQSDGQLLSDPKSGKQYLAWRFLKEQLVVHYDNFSFSLQEVDKEFGEVMIGLRYDWSDDTTLRLAATNKAAAAMVKVASPVVLDRRVFARPALGPPTS